MRSKVFKVLVISILFSSVAWGQTLQDAIRYSRLQSGGTARSISTGGALSAFGGDFGTLSINPAGIATYRKGTLVVTPSLNFNSTNADFNGGTFDEIKSNISLDNIGIVFSKTNKESDWKTVNFAVGTNRLANFHQEFFYDGENNGTIAERWTSFANGNFPNELYAFEEGIAYDANVIFNLPDNSGNIDSTFYYSDMGPNDPVQKQQTVTRAGGVNDLVITLGGNYRDKIAVGVTIGLPFVNFEERKAYREIDSRNINTFFNEMTYEENLTTTGVGINAKLGVIYRASQRLRIGAAIHSPTFFTLSDNYFTTLTSDLTFDNQSYETTAESPISNFSYQLNTPWRAVGSVGYLLGKFGFLTGEVEYVDYSAASFNLTSQSTGDALFEQDLNTEIEENLTRAINLRVGGELRFGVLAVRGGMGIYSTPYQSGYTGRLETYQNYSFGLGLRERNLFIDLGVSNTRYNQTYSPFTVPDSDTGVEVENSISNTRFVGSIGFRF